MRSAVPPFLGLQSPYDGRSDNAARSPCTPPPITRRLTPTIDRNISDGDLSTTEEWTSVLALATQWEFADYRRLAIARLAQLASPVDRILLGRRYDIPEWLSTAYLELCTQFRRTLNLRIEFKGKVNLLKFTGSDVNVKENSQIE